MKKLLIIGAGGFGREVLTMAVDNPNYNVNWTIKGFLDNRPGVLDGFTRHPGLIRDPMDYDEDKLSRYRRDYPVLGDPLTYVPQEGDVFLCAIGDPAQRRKYTAALIERGVEFVKLVHPLAAVSSFASIGPGSIIGAYASLSPDCRIGQHVTISNYTAVAHDTTIGDWVEIGAHCLIAGNVSVSSGARIHPGSIITAKSRVGEDAVVAAGSVVFKYVKSNTTVLGNPARRFDWKPDDAPDQGQA
ncbi:sugar O-acyltransferase, sialic acid O-acetyltransferase NeuD family [Paraburkholderia atlantica]|uniref:Sugar O-acyltransferase, sialic acid O-acetyltransferase NeuD family n=1 Tax=Paraburkholderia atlantica TaxID=2654982 RepID=D5W6J4_PARAM|nr:acetyltransferase [Paraburkholderia atlantica]ADG17115.1 sugar O-acyltransferase, sialic acid O-acetyltransferase NeuD family [Paraburkholderia atlantica]